VLIEGESGTGKELFAQGIHMASRRSLGPFVALNCAAFPESLLESELFGYDEGAFTGSRRGGKPGLVELADRGTLFLDEIGDMPISLQTRLLRVLQEKEVLRLGAAEPLPVDVRVVAATHARLKQSVEQGTFRADLYFRLAILVLPLPALRDRGGDLARLARWIADEALQRVGWTGGVVGLLEPMLAAAAGYGWPGNVRELQNVVERLSVYLGAKGVLTVDDVIRLAPELASGQSHEQATTSGLDAMTVASRRSHAEAVLAACGGDRRSAAEQLGVSRTTLWRLLRGPA
jgi:propionate catabolism operon transcriptional regulator